MILIKIQTNKYECHLTFVEKKKIYEHITFDEGKYIIIL